MRMSMRVTGTMAVAVVLLTGAWAAGQSQKESKKGKAGGGTQNAATNPHFKSNENAGDMPQQGISDKKNTNPTYQENKNQGTNPLYESPVDDNDPARHHATENKTTTVQPPAKNAIHETVEYKDPEDMTTRYRPGNNKTTKVQATGSKTQKPN